MSSDFIPLSAPNLKGNELKYVSECIETEWVSSVGKYVNQFEDDLAKFTDSKFAVACMNGTAALQIALMLAGVKENEEVIVPSLTFIASVNSIKYLNAIPIFLDSDEYYNLDPNEVLVFLNNEVEYKNHNAFNKKTGRRIAAIMPVHVFGNACNIEPYYNLAKALNIPIVEDMAESLGTTYTSGLFAGKSTGTIGLLAATSFNGNKIITTGGGGMILTQNEELAKKAKYLTTTAKDDNIYFVHNQIGYNYRMTNIQAALGVAQLESLEKFLQIKKNNYNIYYQEINKIEGLKIKEVPSYSNNNYWMYALEIDDRIYPKNRDELLIYFKENNIETRPIWKLNHLQTPYTSFQQYKLDNCLNLYNKTLNIPCSTNLTEAQVRKVISLL